MQLAKIPMYTRTYQQSRRCHHNRCNSWRLWGGFFVMEIPHCLKTAAITWKKQTRPRGKTNLALTKKLQWYRKVFTYENQQSWLNCWIRNAHTVFITASLLSTITKTITTDCRDIYDNATKPKVKLTTVWRFRLSADLPPGRIGVLKPSSLGDTDNVTAINYNNTTTKHAKFLLAPFSTKTLQYGIYYNKITKLPISFI